MLADNLPTPWRGGDLTSHVTTPLGFQKVPGVIEADWGDGDGEVVEVPEMEDLNHCVPDWETGSSLNDSVISVMGNGAYKGAGAPLDDKVKDTGLGSCLPWSAGIARAKSLLNDAARADWEVQDDAVAPVGADDGLPGDLETLVQEGRLASRQHGTGPGSVSGRFEGRLRGGNGDEDEQVQVAEQQTPRRELDELEQWLQYPLDESLECQYRSDMLEGYQQQQPPLPQPMQKVPQPAVLKLRATPPPPTCKRPLLPKQEPISAEPPGQGLATSQHQQDDGRPASGKARDASQGTGSQAVGPHPRLRPLAPLPAGFTSNGHARQPAAVRQVQLYGTWDGGGMARQFAVQSPAPAGMQAAQSRNLTGVHLVPQSRTSAAMPPSLPAQIQGGDMSLQRLSAARDLPGLAAVSGPAGLSAPSPPRPANLCVFDRSRVQALSSVVGGTSRKAHSRSAVAGPEAEQPLPSVPVALSSGISTMGTGPGWSSGAATIGPGPGWSSGAATMGPGPGLSSGATTLGLGPGLSSGVTMVGPGPGLSSGVTTMGSGPGFSSGASAMGSGPAAFSPRWGILGAAQSALGSSGRSPASPSPAEAGPPPAAQNRPAYPPPARQDQLTGELQAMLSASRQQPLPAERKPERSVSWNDEVGVDGSATPAAEAEKGSFPGPVPLPHPIFRSGGQLQGPCLRQGRPAEAPFAARAPEPHPMVARSSWPGVGTRGSAKPPPSPHTPANAKLTLFSKGLYAPIASTMGNLKSGLVSRSDEDARTSTVTGSPQVGAGRSKSGGEESTDQTVTSSSAEPAEGALAERRESGGQSGGSAQTEGRKRKPILEAEAPGDAETVDTGVSGGAEGEEDSQVASGEKKKQPRSTKRARAAEVHNQSERRRRDRINEKMKALQELIPNSNKTDKASMLDEAIEYLKMLQLQLQVMSMRTGMTLQGGPGSSSPTHHLSRMGGVSGELVARAAGPAMNALGGAPSAGLVATMGELQALPQHPAAFTNPMLGSSFLPQEALRSSFLPQEGLGFLPHESPGRGQQLGFSDPRLSVADFEAQMQMLEQSAAAPVARQAAPPESFPPRVDLEAYASWLEQQRRQEGLKQEAFKAPGHVWGRPPDERRPH